MSYYSYFEGDHQAEIDKINQRRQLLIDRARQYEPVNLAALLAASDDGEIGHELEWVQIPDPRNNAKVLTVRPVLGYARGNETDPEEKDRYDGGLGSILLEGRLPSGEERVIGMMSMFYINGDVKFEPTLNVNTSGQNGIGTDTGWKSADAELWLRATERAMDAQPA